MDIKELKAAAYDAIRQIEMWQAKLRELEIKISQAEKEK